MSELKNRIILIYPELKPKLDKLKDFWTDYSFCVTDRIFRWGFGAEIILAALCFEKYINDETKCVDLDADVISVLESAKAMKYEIDTASETPLIINQAFFIVVADAFYRLDLIEKINEDSDFYCRTLEQNMLPNLQKNKAVKIMLDLEEKLTRIQYTDDYNYIKQSYEKVLVLNNAASKKVINAFEGVCEDNELIKQLIVEKPRFNSYYRKMNRERKTFGDFQPLNKSNMVLYDITIIFENSVVKNSESNLLDAFLKIYKDKLIDTLYIMNKINTNLSDTYFLKITDKLGNWYRIFLKTENEYLKYNFGTVVEQEKMLLLDSVDLAEKITVYDSAKKPYELLAGDTLIDFAFGKSTYNGLRFKSAVINGICTNNPYQVLHNNDVIELILHDSPNPELLWIRNCHNKQTVKKLIEYFSGQK